MDTPTPKPTNSNQRKFLFINDQNQAIDIFMEINNNKLIISTELNENNLGKKKYSSFYSFDAMKEKNKFFCLCQDLEDALNQIEILILKNKNNVTFKKSDNKIMLSVPTNINLSPQIIFELKEIDDNISKDLDAPDISELYKDNNNTPGNNNNGDKNIILFLKERIYNLEKQMSILNMNFGILPEYYFNRIKEWICGDKNKIRFNLIFKLEEHENNLDRYHKNVNLNCSQIFIFITGNSSIFGSFCPKYSITSLNPYWVDDQNAFLFSLNLDKKYPAKKADKNYFIAKCGYHFRDITFCHYDGRKGTFAKSGTYLDKYELEGNNNEFFVKHFLVYKVEYI